MVILIGGVLNRGTTIFTEVLKMNYAIWMDFLYVAIELVVLIVMTLLSIKALKKSYEI